MKSMRLGVVVLEWAVVTTNANKPNQLLIEWMASGMRISLSLLQPTVVDVLEKPPNQDV